jgi:D-alanine-D-alanine ligase
MSAQSVMSALDSDKYDIVMIGINKQGKWLTGNVLAALNSGTDNQVQTATLLPNPMTSSLMKVEKTETQLATLSEVAELDVVFPILHGPYGEDGTVQGLLELAGIPYVGAGVVGSAVGMDKGIFKAVMETHCIPILSWQLVQAADWRSDPNSTIIMLESVLDYPMFTKPANLGSSVGISRCEDKTELKKGLNKAARYDRRIVVEQGIKARELEVSVLGNDDPISSVVGEIIPKRDFYDYEAKYVSDDSELIIPADLTPDISEEIQQLAIRAFKAVDCAGMARVDFLMNESNGELYINELNTIPGFTRISMYPKLWEATGISYSELLDRLIALAMDRFSEKERLETTYDVVDSKRE